MYDSSDDNIISSIDRSGRPARSPQPNRDVNFDAVLAAHALNPAPLINALNDNMSSVALHILNDTSENKADTFEKLSKASAAAKSILADIQDNQETMRLDATRGVAVLQLLNNIYDNTIRLI
ncbi:P12 [Olene mendosa nucleopolyhedrovirus]|uniref:P12 n=1 Tax=Olene mendosa nucleopolyhedrovirus TaxID=2933796 RepID=A0AAX3AU57_9ABAC|nr:P12 [Olene mendosa nucleopolyhedrovirus]UOQ18876.1 P12 [Olene mendosa nucleopolyhedrovirus]